MRLFLSQLIVFRFFWNATFYLSLFEGAEPKVFAIRIFKRALITKWTRYLKFTYLDPRKTTLGASVLLELGELAREVLIGDYSF